MKFCYNSPSGSFEEMFEIVILKEPWITGQTMTLTSSSTNLHVLMKITLITNFRPNFP